MASTPTVSPIAANVWYHCSPAESTVSPPPWVQEMSKSACQSIQPASTSITTQIAGPARPWKWRTASMPLRTISSWMPQSSRNAIQPSRSKPRNRISVSDSMPGMNRTSNTFSATEARNVCTPYQAMATMPRTSAVNRAPQTPQDRRLTTG